MNNYVRLLIEVVAIGAIFVYLWRTGQLVRLRTYLEETREELKKCTWPTWAELKGSTVVVLFSIFLLGAFTVGSDGVFYYLNLIVDSISKRG